MEMRVIESKQELGQVQEINFNEFEINMLIVLEEEEGVVVIDIEDNEKYYTGNNLKNIFEIINKKTVKKISYINDYNNEIKINKFYITLINNEKYIVELL